MIKRLEPKSIYAKYDINQDGTVSDEEIARNKELLELELKEEKSEEHRKIAWVAMLCIIILLIILLTPIVSESRVKAIEEIIKLTFVVLGGLIGTYMGVSTWMSRK